MVCRFALPIVCMLWCTELSSVGAEESLAPNIVFILLDDFGWMDAGYQGSTYYETPAIDQLAASGMVFTNAYANAPNCAPTRACLLSGQYSPRHGLYTVGNSTRGHAEMRKVMPVPNHPNLRANVVTMADSLKVAGYKTAAIGKWHLGAGKQYEPEARGFDLGLGNYWRARYFSPYGDKTLPDGPHGEYLTDRLTDEAVDFIQQNKDRPFFLYLAHHAVHSPWQAKDRLIEKYQLKKPGLGQESPTYAAMIESADHSVERIVASLDQWALSDKTVVVLFSDNGGVGPVTSMEPLRGAKGMLYEGGIRVPMIVRWPGKVRSGSRCDTPVIGVDFYPTLLEIAGTERPALQPLDGQSLLPLLTGMGTFAERALFWHFPCYLQSWGCVHVPWRTTPVGAVRQGDWKLLEFFEEGRLELYHLTDDLGEQTNLADAKPEQARKLHKMMRAWRKQVRAPVPERPNPEYDPTFVYKHDPEYRGRGTHQLPLDAGEHFRQAMKLGY